MKTLDERFWTKVERRSPEECWPWLAAKNTNGYGHLGINRKTVYAHRVAYELMIGPIPPGMKIDHTCHARECVNPSHLRICTQSENVQNSLLRSDNASGFKGVHKHSETGKWIAQIQVDGKGVHVGVFDTPEDAHAAYCKEASLVYGEFANSGKPDRFEREEAS